MSRRLIFVALLLLHVTNYLQHVRGFQSTKSAAHLSPRTQQWAGFFAGECALCQKLRPQAYLLRLGASDASKELDDNSTRTKTRQLTGFLQRRLEALSKTWRKLAWWVRKLTTRYTIYVLECEHGKYYVGSTINQKRRLRQHQSERGGSKWTRLHKPLGVLREYKRIPTAYYLGMEAKVTAQTMLQYGVNNVRGAMFAEPRNYTLADVRALTGFLGHYNDMNYKDVRYRLERELAFVSGTRNKRKQKRRAKLKQNDQCFNCGQRGHWANECPEVWGTTM